MNINEIKAFMREKPAHLGDANSLKNQLRESGLEQASAFAGDKASLSNAVSSKGLFGAQVLTSSFNRSLTIGFAKPDIRISAQEDKQDANKGMFDFEEVARNVLNFVGGAIKNAQGKGADDEALYALFEQARSGVLKGIGMAEKDLAGVMNDDIKTGISRSQELIDTGLQKLQDTLLGVKHDVIGPQEDNIAVQSQVNYQRVESGALRIRTADGDEVNIRFEDFESFEFNRSLFKEVQGDSEFIGRNPVEPSKPAAPSAVDTNSQDEASELGEDDDEAQVSALDGNPNGSPDEGTQASAQITSEERYAHFNSSALSFTVQGQLDEDELNAIGALVTDASDLADEFFNGDIENAFHQALKLGFDEKELTGFALQLTKQEQTQSIQAYESVSHFSEDDPRGDPNKSVKPVAHYLDRMLDVFEQSRQKLESSEQYDDLINGLINQMGEVHTPDLITAIQRFHSFNQKLLNGLPLNFSQNKPQE